jgi:hypothetical protein
LENIFRQKHEPLELLTDVIIKKNILDKKLSVVLLKLLLGSLAKNDHDIGF